MAGVMMDTSSATWCQVSGWTVFPAEVCLFRPDLCNLRVETSINMSRRTQAQDQAQAEAPQAPPAPQGRMTQGRQAGGGGPGWGSSDVDWDWVARVLPPLPKEHQIKWATPGRDAKLGDPREEEDDSVYIEKWNTKLRAELLSDGFTEGELEYDAAGLLKCPPVQTRMLRQLRTRALLPDDGDGGGTSIPASGGQTQAGGAGSTRGRGRTQNTAVKAPGRTLSRSTGR